jgi:predicted nucleic acid-binding protein
MHKTTFCLDDEVRERIARAAEPRKKNAALSLGLVDTVVMAQAERHRAEAILTTDGRRLRAAELPIAPAPALPLLDDR